MTDRFEYPLPSLSVSVDALHMETNGHFTGSFTVKNTGGGALSGKVLSRCPGLTFSPAAWDGNSQTISYTFNAADAALTTGQSLTSHAFISSNGGEIKLPVTVKFTKMVIDTDEGVSITNLQEFYDYALAYPAQGRRLFVDSNFYMLLLATGYKYMEVYEFLHKDANRERALDNFFILSGFKGKTTLSVVAEAGNPFASRPRHGFPGAGKSLKFVQNPNGGAMPMLDGFITVRKSDSGYVEAPITVHGDAPWLNFYASKLMQKDFKGTLTTRVNFSIDPIKISGAYARALVTIGTNPANTVEIVYSRAAPLVVHLNQGTYAYEDKGMLQITNNTGKDIKVEIFCPDNYLRFSARSYLVGAYGEVPFDVKLPALASAGRLLKKVPYMKTTIEVRALVDTQPVRKILPVVIGQW